MTTIAPTYVKPNVYFKIEDVPAPISAVGDFIPLFVGLGRKELDVLATLTKQDPLVSNEEELTGTYIPVSIISIVDQNDISYTENVDFLFERQSGVGVADDYNINWTSPLAITGTETETFNVVLATNDVLKLTIDGISFTTTITAGAALTAAAIIAEINTAYGVAGGTGSPASDAAGIIVFTADSVIIDGGNALTVLGFIKGDKVVSIQPAEGVTYTVGYKRIKVAAEYEQKIFTRLEDLYADQGDGDLALVPTTLFTEATGAGISLAAVTNSTKLTAVTDTNATFITDEVVAGSYLKVTGSSGIGEIKVITEVISETVVHVPNFDEDMDATSTYIIKDIGDYQISHAANLANQGGAQQFIVSQTPNDIVDDANWRGAIDLTIQNVDGSQGWCLVPMMSLDSTESLVSYIKAYLATVNSTTGGKERIALFGSKVGLTAAQINTYLTGTLDSRVGIVVNPSMVSNGNTYGSEYVAAYICGIICNPDYNSGEPISGKVIALDTVTDEFTDFEKRQFGQNGGIVVEKQGVDYKIVHFISTDATDINALEMKVTKQKDGLKKSLRSTLETAIVNTRATDIARARAESITRLVLEDKVNRQEINEFTNLSVEFESTDPRQLNVSFLFKPTYDVNYVLVTFGATIS